MYFEKIDTLENAYLLGRIVGQGRFYDEEEDITFYGCTNDIKYLRKLRDVIDKNIPFVCETMISFTIPINNVTPSTRAYLKCPSTLPDVSDALKWVFINGYFDNAGHISGRGETPECSLAVYNGRFRDSFVDFCRIPTTLDERCIEYKGTNAIDFMGKMYKSNCALKVEKNFRQYRDWFNVDYKGDLPKCRVTKTDPRAIIPSKTNESDVGYDLTVIKKEKILVEDYWADNDNCLTTGGVTLYDTGLKIELDHGYYAEIVPRSSLSKSGYMLANSVGVIDPNYSGNLYIALVKINADVPEPQMPFRCCQMVIRRQYHVEIVETKEKLAESSRGAGGFGSTN